MQWKATLTVPKRIKKYWFFWRSIAAAAMFGAIFLSALVWNNKTNNGEFADNKNNHESQNNYSNNLSSSQKKILTEETSSASRNTNTVNSFKEAIQNKKNSSPNFANKTPKIIEQKKSRTNRGIKKEFHLNKLTPIIDVNITSYSDINAKRLLKNDTKTKSFVTNDMLWTSFNSQQKIKTDLEKKSLQFAIGGQFSPTYSYRETNSSSQTNAINEDGIVSYTGGLNLSIRSRKKWSVETGVYYSQIGQKFTNPLLSTGKSDLYVSAEQEAGIEGKKPNLSNSMGSIKLNSASEERLIQDVAKRSSAFRPNSEFTDDQQHQAIDKIKVQQELNYIEVPFLLRYNLIEKSIGLSIAGGMSTNFLVTNGAYELKNGNKEKIGEIENINSVSYSAILGFGIRTPLFKSVDFNFEPKLRYFINSINEGEGNSYKPYSIGVYTGISYRF